MDFIYRDIEDQTPMLTRGTYDTVRSHLRGIGVIAPNTISKLDYIIAAAFVHGYTELGVTLAELEKIMDRLNIVLLCGGYAINRLRKGMELTPVPIHPTHYREIRDYIYKIAERLSVSVVFPEGVEDQLDYVLKSGLTSHRYIRAAVDPEFMGVVFSATDMRLNHDVAPMRGRTNDELFTSLVSNWQGVTLGTTLVFEAPKRDDITTVRVLDGTVLPPIKVVPSELSYKGLMFMEPAHYKDDTFYEDPSQLVRLTSQDALLAQTEVRILTDKKIIMTATKLKLYTILRLLTVYYGKSMPDYCTNLRTLDLCADPGNMTELLLALGARAYMQNFPGADSANVCTTIRNWFFIPAGNRVPVDWSANITSSTDNHTYDLVVADGYDPVFGIEQQHELFWLEVYVALHKLAYSGTLVIKTVNNFVELFGPRTTVPTVDVGLDIHVARFILEIDGRARCELFSRFAHWALVKPIGSSFANSERYLVLMGYRPTPTMPADYHSLRSVYNIVDCDIDNAVRAACACAKAMQPTQKYVLAEQIPALLRNVSFEPRIPSPIYTDQDVNATLSESLMPLESTSQSFFIDFVPQVLTDAVVLWGQVFTTEGVLTLLDSSTVQLKVPSTFCSITVTANRYAQLAEHMIWCTKAISVNNHKAFMLEMAQNNGFANRFKTSYHSEGPKNMLTWRAVVTWGDDGADVGNVFIASVLRRAFTSKWMPTKKVAEQAAFKLAVGSYTGAVITEIAIKDPNVAGTRSNPLDNIVIGGANVGAVKNAIDMLLKDGPVVSEQLRKSVRAICRGVTKKEISNVLYSDSKYVHVMDGFDKIWSIRPASH